MERRSEQEVLREWEEFQAQCIQDLDSGRLDVQSFYNYYLELFPQLASRLEKSDLYDLFMIVFTLRLMISPDVEAELYSERSSQAINSTTDIEVLKDILERRFPNEPDTD